MNDNELQKIVEEIIKIGESDIEYIKEQDNLSEEYKKGWEEGIDQLVLELLGRKEEDKTQKLKEVIEK